MDKMIRRLGAVLAMALLLQPANAAIIYKSFNAFLGSGPYAGTAFNGTFSYDNAGVTGIGTEYFGLSSFNFTLLGTAFSKADIDQGGQVIAEWRAYRFHGRDLPADALASAGIRYRVWLRRSRRDRLHRTGGRFRTWQLHDRSRTNS